MQLYIILIACHLSKARKQHINIDAVICDSEVTVWHVTESHIPRVLYNALPRLPGNKVCSVGSNATVTAGVSLTVATVFVTTTVGIAVLRLRGLSSLSSTSDMVDI